MFKHSLASWRQCALPGLLLLALVGCGGGGSGGSPDDPLGLQPKPPAATSITPAGVVTQSPTLTLEQQDGGSTAGAQVSTSPNFTLVSEGVSP